MTPKEPSRKENENKVWRTLYPEFGGKTIREKFSIGDNVRITKKRKTFDKGYTQRWTEEVFKIYKIQLTIPVTYKITDYNGEKNKRFVLWTRTSKDEARHMYDGKNKIQERNKNLVKWLGYNESFNSWVDNKSIKQL